jgi:hypothetical protein
MHEDHGIGRPVGNCGRQDSRHRSVDGPSLLIDGVVKGTYTPASNNYTLFTTPSFTVTTGSHTLEFLESSGTGNALVDAVSIA